MNLRASLAVVVLSAGSLLSTSCGGSCEDCGGFGPNFLVRADTALPTTLGTQSTFTITVESFDFSGPVALTVSGLPAGWTSSVTDTSLAIAAGDSLKLPVVVTVPSTGPAAAGGQNIGVEVTIDGVPRTTGTRLVVANEYIVHFHPGASTGPHWGALQATGFHVNVGTLLSIQNDDTVAHLIHYNGAVAGLAHQSVGAPIAPGGSYSQTPLEAGTDLIACHAHSHTDTLRVTIP